jgi:hypothetical protein
MRKLRDDSRLEIWSYAYINNVKNRDKNDQNVELLQIERGSNGYDYIVEIIDKPNNDILVTEEQRESMIMEI